MDEKKIDTLSREELYRMVWTQPVTKWSQKYGLSDVGFAKICKKMNVPLPGRGYWSMVKKGLKINQPILEPMHDPKQTTIKIEIREPKPKESKNIIESDPLVLFEMMPENKIIVPENIGSFHPLVKTTKMLLKSRPIDKYGRIINKKLSCFDIHVSEESLPRALRVVDTLIKALEKRGMKVAIKYNNIPNITLFIRGEELEIAVEEGCKQREHQLTKEEIKNNKFNHFLLTDHYDYEPTGEVSIIIKTYTRAPIRRRWADTKSRKIEECLNKMIIGFIKAADEVKNDRLQREKEHNERLEQERLYAEIQRQKAEEKGKYNELIRQVEAWTQSRAIINYAEHVKNSAINKYGKIEEGSGLEKWLTWAGIIAQQLDPTIDIIG